MIWAKPKCNRMQAEMMSPSLDETISVDHKIRRLESLLLKIDWSSWEDKYDKMKGQPPIHPMLIAGMILYGLTERIRSSRDLEKATKLRIDFMWFLHKRTIDHSTFSAFNTRFKDALKDLFKQLALIALKEEIEVGLAIDGTRFRSNSKRDGSLRTATIEERAEELAQDLIKRHEQLKQVDIADNPDGATQDELTEEIARLQYQQRKLAAALREGKKRDAAKKGKSDSRKASKARTPITDPDSHVMNNKDGGSAPNYTPVAAADINTGAILSASIASGADEASMVEKAVADVKDITGELPKKVLADSSFASGQNLEALDRDGIEMYSSAGKTTKDNPAIREDVTSPVSKELWDKLPMKGKKSPVLDKEAFIYDSAQDCFYCPIGRKLDFYRNQTRKTKNYNVKVREFRCNDCSGCPLAEKCLSRKAKRRMISRDEFEGHREKLREHMSSDEAHEIYSKRAPVIEGVFAQIKHNMGIRGFVYRGIDKVESEWLWICSAFNLAKILKSMLKTG
jgi:transposase